MHCRSDCPRDCERLGSASSEQSVLSLEICCASYRLGTMSVTGKTGIGIPTLLLHEGEGLIVTLELRDGTTVRGMLDSSQDNFNCIMKDAIRTDPMGRTDTVPHLFVRGGEVRMVILPDIYPFQRQLFVFCLYRSPRVLLNSFSR